MKTTNEPDLENVSMSSEAKNFYLNHFIPRYRKSLDEIKRKPLVILVWGPGKGGGKLYRKRCEIREELRKIGHAAIFSEEIEKDVPEEDYSLRIREKLQAENADFIIVLQASMGSTGEVHDFGGILSIASKMLIFIDKNFEEGYSAHGILQELNILYNNVEKYNYPEDINKCHLLSAVLKKVKVLQGAKWYEEQS